jgi:hypothetical protein
VVSLLRQSPSTWRPSARYISIGALLTLSKTLLAFIACFAVSDGPVLLAVRLVCPSPGLSSPLFRRLFPRTRMIIACFGRPVLSRFLAFFGLANLPVLSIARANINSCRAGISRTVLEEGSSASNPSLQRCWSGALERCLFSALENSSVKCKYVTKSSIPIICERGHD